MTSLQRIVHITLEQMSCSPSAWQSHCHFSPATGAMDVIFPWIKPAFKANRNGSLLLHPEWQPSTASSHRGRRNEGSNLKADPPSTIRHNQEFIEKMAWSVATEMPPVIAHIWKKLLPQNTCHLWRRIKAGQQNIELTAHRTCPCSCPHFPSNKEICFHTHLSWLLFSSLSSRKEFKIYQQKCGCRKGSFLIPSLTKFSWTIVLAFWHMAE